MPRLKNTQKMGEKNTTAIVDVLRGRPALLGLFNINHGSLLIEMEQEEFLNFKSLVNTVDIRRTINTERENIS